MKKLVLVLVVLMAVSVGASANTNLGFDQTCGKYSAADAFGKHESLVRSLGYLSAANQFSKSDVLLTTDVDAIEAALKQYCEKNPLDRFQKAVNSVFIQLMARAPK